jgi:hypothetical protein
MAKAIGRTSPLIGSKLKMTTSFSFLTQEETKRLFAIFRPLVAIRRRRSWLAGRESIAP